jgi:beta-glucanase (GH16 family)/20S proteasome alpha/beta subunit
MTIDPTHLASTATLTFSDEFDSLSLWSGQSGTWDSTFWWAAENGIQITGNKEVNWYINSNYAPTSSVTPWTVSNGILDLHAAAADASIQPYINDAQYTSGMITSYHSFSQLYGYFEMKAQLPGGQGMWPAFWLLPTDNAVFGTVPAQELDILEALGNYGGIDFMTSHSSFTGEMVQQQGALYVPTMSSAFHTYGMDWEADTITWYVDGVKAFQIATPEDMHKPMYILVNLAMYGPGITDTSQPVGGDMLIDYIRAYSAKPPSVEINSFTPDSNVVGDGLTNVNHITLAGTAAVGVTVQIYDGAFKIGTAVANSTGAWSFATPNLADGTHSFTAGILDQAGNVTNQSTALSVTVDITPPPAPVISSFSPDSGTNGDGVTNNSQITLAGSAEAGSTVQICDGSVPIGTTVASSSGGWSFATAPLATGAHAFTARASDIAGNVGALSSTFSVTVALSMPKAPTLLSDKLASGNSVIASGTADAGTIIKLYENAGLLGTCITKSDGTWIVTTGTLSEGAHAFSATATDFAGNTSTMSNVLAAIIGTAIESNGTTRLTKAADNYYLSSFGADVLLKFAGSAVTATEFGNWTPIATEQTASGYQVAWKYAGADQYLVWATDGDGNLASDFSLGVSSGSSAALEMLETDFHQDLNGDGTIGMPTTTIESSGATALVAGGTNFFFNTATGGTGLSLKYSGTAVVSGQFGAWTPIAVEQTATGYDVAWKADGSDFYTVWSTDASGNFLSYLSAVVSGSDSVLKGFESTFLQDLNGDGLIGTASTVLNISGHVKLVLDNMSQAVTLNAGASLELSGAVSGSITFKQDASSLILDHSTQFNGKIFGFSGSDNLHTADILDLRDISFGSGTTASYSGNSKGGVLTVVDAVNHAVHITLVGDYTHSSFKLSGDGSGGTLVSTPPAPHVSLGPTPVASGASAPVASGASMEQIGDGFVFRPTGSTAEAAISDNYLLPAADHLASPVHAASIAQDFTPDALQWMPIVDPSPHIGFLLNT